MAGGQGPGGSGGGDSTLLATLVESVRGDARIALRHLVVNVVAGAHWMPRAGRALVYRLAGIRAMRANVYAGCRFTGTDVEIGERTFINHECYFDVGPSSLRIGRECNLGPQVGIFTMTHDLRPDGSYDRSSRSRPVVVGDRVWVGARATILPGVTVADDVVVAAGAVVASDCTEPGVYGGVPARRIEVGSRA